MDDEDVISHFLKHETGAYSNIPERHAIKCCCGNADCAFLQHNEGALRDLERDVCTASEIGKALLTRHETYIADSERERKAMAAQIQMLEGEKQSLESKNASAIEENRNLLDQLESLNNAVGESDTQVTNLQATLRATQQELQKLSYLSTRTEKLEQQLADFEREQATWQSTIDEKEESAKSALRRWQEAQRTLSGLQEQMERIEKEANEERQRHVELLGRMERRHTVERELDSAASRLKGAAAVKTAGAGTNVVSHFVKDILQDNANLQMGIVELRDMLQTSNEEVETLRKQLSVHQPIVDETVDVQPTSSPTRPHLKDEMRSATAQELHVHHHYHAPSPTTQKTPTLRRPKKKRYGALTPGHYTPPSSGLSTPRYSFSSPSNTAAILSQTAASLPESTNQRHKRWSMQSNQTYQSLHDSSGPGSPQSTNHASSIFDRVFSDAGQDSSRPTTPDTEDPGSPMFVPVNSKRTVSAPYHAAHKSSSSHRVRPSLDSILDMSTENLRELEHQQASEAVIPEEDEADWENTDSPPPNEQSESISPLEDDLHQLLQRPHELRRAASHESILSCRGMDIHTLKSRPSQLLASRGGRSLAPQAVLSDENIHAARPAAISRPMNSGQAILSGIAKPTPRQTSGSKPLGIGSRVGGWMFGKWGAAPTPTSPASDTVSTPTATASNIDVAMPKARRTSGMASGSTGQSGDPNATPKQIKHRPPGINQSGPIVGFHPRPTLQHSPIMKSFDQEALQGALID